MPDQAGTAHQALGPITRRPFVPVAIFFAIGIILHESIAVRPAWLITITAGVLAVAAACPHRRFICSSLLAIAVVISGMAAARVEHFQFSSTDVGLFATDEPHLTELELYLPDEPQLIAGAVGQRELPPKQLVTADVLRIKTWGGWIPATGRLPVQIDQPNPFLNAGQTIRALGMLQCPRAAMNPGEVDWAAFYREQRILATFAVTRGENCKILADSGPSLLSRLRSKARHLLAWGFTPAHAIDHALLKALLLGDGDPQLQDVHEEFLQTGVSFQIKVSGMHVAILGGALLLVCRWFRLRPRRSLAVTLVFVVLYAAVSLPSHSGIRSVIFWIVTAAALCSGRSIDRAQLLSIGVMMMLLWHPMDLLSVGFQISFTVVTAFVVLLPKLDEWERLHGDIDKRVARQTPTLMRAAMSRIISLILRCFQYSLVAWVAMLPLVAYHFGQLTPWSVVGAVLVLPVVIGSLFAGVLKIFLTLCWPMGANGWATAAGWPIELMRQYVHLLTKLPAWTVPLPAPPVWLIAVYYTLLLATLVPESIIAGRKRWLLRLAPLPAVASILALSLFSQLPAATNSAGDLRVTLLSLGAGQCAIVEPPGGHAVIFDAGSTTVPELVRNIVGPFLRAEHQPQVDDIFLSHGDYDHISAAGEIAETYYVRHVFTSYHFRKNTEGNLPDQILLGELERLNLTPREIAVGDHFDLGAGVSADCLWPPKVGELNSNNAGLVLRLTYAGRSILFPADIQDPAFQGLLSHPMVLKSDVLVAPHHGSSEDLTPAFLAAVDPNSIISSNAWRLTNKQKRFDTMVSKTPLYRTSEYGAITVTISRDGKITISTYKKKPAMISAGTALK